MRELEARMCARELADLMFLAAAFSQAGPLLVLPVNGAVVRHAGVLDDLLHRDAEVVAPAREKHGERDDGDEEPHEHTARPKDLRGARGGSACRHGGVSLPAAEEHVQRPAVADPHFVCMHVESGLPRSS